MSTANHQHMHPSHLLKAMDLLSAKVQLVSQGGHWGPGRLLMQTLDRPFAVEMFDSSQAWLR